MSVDPTTLKVGDRVHLTITVGDKTFKISGVVICDDKTKDITAPLFWLDTAFVCNGYNSYSTGYLPLSGKDYVNEQLEKLGEDKNQPRIWHMTPSPAQTVIDSAEPRLITIKAEDCKIGDRVELTITVRDSTPFTTTATALGTSYNGRPVFRLDKRFSHSTYHSFSPSSLNYYAECQRQTEQALASLDFDGSKWLLWGDIRDKTINTTITKYLGRRIPKDMSVDQETLEVGDDIELELERDGSTIKRTATVVATAKSERDRYRNDSEAGLVLHQEIKDKESPSFGLWEHWKSQAEKLKLPTTPKLGWRLYKSGRNKTQITKKLGKRTIDETVQTDLSPGRRVEVPLETANGVELVRGTIVYSGYALWYVVLDSNMPAPEKHIEHIEVENRRLNAAQYGLTATRQNLIRLTKTGVAMRALSEKLLPIPEPKPKSIDDNISILDNRLKSHIPLGTQALDSDVVKEVLAYAIAQRTKERSDVYPTELGSNIAMNPPFNHIDNKDGTTTLEFIRIETATGSKLDALANMVYGLARHPNEPDSGLRARCMVVMDEVDEREATEQPMEQSSFKTELADAGWRVAATTASKAGRQALASFIKVKVGDEGKLALINDFLESEYGRAFLELAVGYALQNSGDPTISRLAEEWRIDALATTGNELIGSVLEFVLPAITSSLETLPETRVAETTPQEETAEPEIETTVQTLTK